MPEEDPVTRARRGIVESGRVKMRGFHSTWPVGRWPWRLRCGKESEQRPVLGDRPEPSFVGNRGRGRLRYA